MKKIKFTKKGLEDVEKEQRELLEKRKEAVGLLKTAREMGDLSENSAYRSAKWKLSSIDSRLRYLDMLIRYGDAVEKKIGIIDIGSTVCLYDGKKEIKLYVVGGHESDILNQKISIFSPLGKSLLGKKEGDIIIVSNTMYTIRQIT